MASIKDQVRAAFLHDGKDHVNVFSHGATNIGKVAFPEWRKKFYIPHLGEFASPRAFANWCVGGGAEELRRETGYVEYKVENLREFRSLMLYAKFFQLTSLRMSLLGEKELLDLPFMMYKKHLTGVREDNKWREYPSVVKQFIVHIVNNGNHVPFDFEAVIPGVTETVNKYLRAFIGEEFVGIDKIEEIRTTPKEKQQPKAKHKKRGQNPEVTQQDQTNQPLQADGAEAQPVGDSEQQTSADVVIQDASTTVETPVVVADAVQSATEDAPGKAEEPEEAQPA